MTILFVLIIISLILASGFLIAFFWATKNGQFEDDYTPSVRMLFDDELTETDDPLKTDTTKTEVENKDKDIEN